MNRKTLAVVRSFGVGAFMLSLASCGGNDSGPQERTVRVDYSHDEFASYFLEYFPREVTLRPGDTAVFKQTWTGEPHSVTMGTSVDEVMKIYEPFLQKVRAGQADPFGDSPPEVAEAEERLPFMFGEFGDVLQGAAQPCYLDTGFPQDANNPCPKRDQPDFNGKQSYYSSGFIPYEGSGGNEFRVPLADDITPGTYFYYCNYHGPRMSGKITVDGEQASIPSQDEVNKVARQEIEKLAAPLRDQIEVLKKGDLKIPEEQVKVWQNAGFIKPGTNLFRGNISGLYADDPSVTGGINEFYPRDFSVKVNEPVRWANLGLHTISFNVPKYVPVISVENDGKVVYNPNVVNPAGGIPSNPGPFNFQGPPMEPLNIDGGTWDGKGFYSTGLIGWAPFVNFEMKFSKAGTYKYACLIHPPMVGTIVVK